MIRRYCLFGNPVEHSQSPKIHALFAEQVQRRVEYTKTQCSEDAFISTVKAFQQSGGHGCNITVPFKGLAFELCDTLSEGAKRAQAVNTIKFLSDGSIAGFNTDGSGLVADFRNNLQLSIKEKRILIAGAGGATRGILQPLLSEKPEQIVITNRSLDKAEQLVKEFSDIGNVTSSAKSALQGEVFDIVINATSLGLDGRHPELPKSAIGVNTVAYDLVYSNTETAFVTWAIANNARTAVDGLGMLLEQAADAFFIWEGVRPKTRLITPRMKRDREERAKAVV